MTLKLRRAVAEDRERVLAISAQIWDGDDYVPEVFDQWIADPDSEFVVAELDGRLVAFARRGWLFPGYAWLQGIRTDPAFRGHGAAKAITDHFIEAARADGAVTIGLSTYIDNEASIHIIEQRGFRRVASFVLVEGTLALTSIESLEGAVDVGPEQAWRFIIDSPWHRMAGGYYPCNWTIYPLERTGDAPLRETSLRLGVVDGDRLRSLLCLSPSADAGGTGFLCFLDGEPEDFEPLLAAAVRRSGSDRIAAMIPRRASESASALGPLRGYGIQPWKDGREDTFAYELDLASGS